MSAVAGMLLFLAADPCWRPQDHAAPARRGATSAVLVKAADAIRPEIYLVGELRITKASIQSDPTGTNAASAFLEIDNRGLAPDQLVDAKIGVADRVSVVGDGTRGAEGGLVIPPGAMLDLVASGPHLLLEGLHRRLKDGDRIAGTLQFKQAGDLPIEFTVENSGGAKDQP